MKHRLILLLFSLGTFLPAAWGCELCGAQQPKILRGLTHGSGPQGPFDYLIVSAAAVVVLVSLGYAIKFIVHPGERQADHIKRIVIQSD